MLLISANTMVIKTTMEYLAQPLDSMDVAMLKHTIVCGATAIVVVMLGISRLLVMLFYLLVVGMILIVAWLYSLEYQKRALLVERIEEVVNVLMQTCIKEALDRKNGRAKKDNEQEVDEQKDLIAATDDGDQNACTSTTISGDGCQGDIVDVFSKLMVECEKD